MPDFLNVDAINVAHGDIQALWDVSLEVGQGEIVALIGPNGAGKTTLMRAIAGLHPLKSGTVLLRDKALHALPAHRIVEQGVIMVPEGRRLFGGLTVMDNLELGAYSKRAREVRANTLELVFELFPLLAERRTQRANTMSGGQQQMLAVGRALMGVPKLLMLDEPSLGLGPLVVENIFETVRQMNQQGVTIFLVEQNARQALELAHRAYILEQGRIVGTGLGDELLRDDRVQQAYLGICPAPEE
ncbi:MAG: branched-chain amino acid ABC transporter ATP-binding protein [Actinobacteria bacterium RBG_16_64_13]|nr:MAG: branched-chain amino acid ABC transporter ATP-binding protein [Actinobacteria bacterium RBG_16_64_13]